MKKYLSPSYLVAILAITAYLVLLLITAAHRQPPLFDERLFVPNIYLFEQYGFSRTFLLEMDNQAPGPLYQLVHVALKRLTHFSTPGIRLVNTAMLAGIILMIAWLLRQLLHAGWKRAFLLSAGIMSIPMVWLVSGMALTEVPPMFFATLSVCLLWLALQREQRRFPAALLLALLGGAALGLSIWGRSPFLVIAPAAVCLLWGNLRNGRRWALLVLYSGVSLAMCLPVFMIWKGLMPPKQALVGAGGFSLWHGILAFAYGAMATLLVAPRWFIFNRRILLYLVAAYPLLLLLNIALLQETYAPLSEALRQVLPAALMRLYPYLVAPALCLIAIYFGICSLLRAREHQGQPFFLFLLAGCLLLLASSAGVTHLFSSRYVAQAVPLLMLVLAGYQRFSYARCALFAAGMVMGVLSLETYFRFN